MLNYDTALSLSNTLGKIWRSCLKPLLELIKHNCCIINKRETILFTQMSMTITDISFKTVTQIIMNFVDKMKGDIWYLLIV